MHETLEAKAGGGVRGECQVQALPLSTSLNLSSSLAPTTRPPCSKPQRASPKSTTLNCASS
jgi:hypothetical protein